MTDAERIAGLVDRGNSLLATIRAQAVQIEALTARVASVETAHKEECLRSWHIGDELLAAEAQVQALQQALKACLVALYEVVHHADDECGFMVPVWSAIKKAEAARAVAGDPAQER